VDVTLLNMLVRVRVRIGLGLGLGLGLVFADLVDVKKNTSYSYFLSFEGKTLSYR
jgi:hypothetical protein